MTKYLFIGQSLKSLNSPPVFPGIRGYEPLPLDFPYDRMTPRQIVDEIRHYITIAQQKQRWEQEKRQVVKFLKRAPK